MALLCNSGQVGQLTLFTSSFLVSAIYVPILLILFFYNLLPKVDRFNQLLTLLARAERFELPSAVLETVILPLNYARSFVKPSNISKQNNEQGSILPYWIFFVILCFCPLFIKWQNGIPVIGAISPILSMGF
jgi:hypothetical protein